MTKHSIGGLTLAAVLTVFAAAAAQANDRAAPPAVSAPTGPLTGSVGLLAGNCFNCHGTDGRSTQAIPPLAGVGRDDLLSILREYRDGKREATIMHQLVKGYSDDELTALSDYFSKLPQ